MTLISSKTFGVLALTALAATTLSSVAIAQEAPPKMDFSAMDTNSDGNITKAEAEAYQAAEIAKMDANKDGKISAEELTAFHLTKMKQDMDARAKDRAAKMIEHLDTDKDGALSTAEMAAGPGAAKMFDRVDGNSDGMISTEELAAAKNFMGKGRRGGDHKGEHKGGGFWGMFGK
jgi:Ca2+-binding EF-hand superfamily protein